MNRPRLHRSLALSATIGALVVFGTGVASGTSPTSERFCTADEVTKVWYGGEQDAWSYRVCGDLRDRFARSPYPGTMFSTAYSGTYRMSVTEIQLALHDAGYTPIVIDGYYGNQTADAVRRYQHNHRLTVDGTVGPRTWAILLPGLPEGND